jgi:signal transduction histidine kinase
VRRPRPAIWLTALAVAVVGIAGSFGAAGGQADRRGIDALAIVLLLVGPAALAVRDRWPVGAAATTIAAACVFIGAGYPFGPIFLSVVVGLFSAVQSGRRAQTLLVAVGGYFGLFAALAVDSRTTGVSWLHWALVAGWLAVVLMVSEVVRVQREQTAARARAAEEARRQRLAEQRMELAQELHDVLAHHISLINVQASVALHLLDDEPGRARPALTAIKDASAESLHELRTALDTLRGDGVVPRSPSPRLADLDELVDGVRASGLDVRLEQRGPVGPMPAAVELAAYRIVQEALTNVTRHAHARTATVRVTYGDPLLVEVTDDGVGGAAPAGNGIAGMRERSAALGGTVEVGARGAGGFSVVARLPVAS